MADIHECDVKELLHDNEDVITMKRMQFEKYKVMTDLIANIQKEEGSAI